MGRADSIIKRVDAALTKTGGFDKQIYKRVVTVTGGDNLIGRPGTVNKVDTLMSPQPFAVRLGRDRIPGGHAVSETLIDSSGRMVLADDYMIMCSPTSVSLDELQNTSIQFVFKDAAGHEEVLSVHDFETVTFQNTDCMYSVYVRSANRP